MSLKTDRSGRVAGTLGDHLDAAPDAPEVTYTKPFPELVRLIRHRAEAVGANRALAQRLRTELNQIAQAVAKAFIDGEEIEIGLYTQRREIRDELTYREGNIERANKEIDEIARSIALRCDGVGEIDEAAMAQAMAVIDAEEAEEAAQENAPIDS